VPGGAWADGPFDVIARRGASWTYDVLEARSRFGQDDRIYRVTVSLSKAGGKGATTWHLAWRGTYVVPEDPDQHRLRYRADVDFDPAIGFTRICKEDTCFALAAPAP
jgi:hypothetical protein